MYTQFCMIYTLYTIYTIYSIYSIYIYTYIIIIIIWLSSSNTDPVLIKSAGRKFIIYCSGYKRKSPIRNTE